MFKSTSTIIANFPLNSGRCKKFGGGIKREVSGEVNDNCWNFLQKIHIESLNNCRNFKRFETAILLEFRNCSGINHRVNSLEWSQKSIYTADLQRRRGHIIHIDSRLSKS